MATAITMPQLSDTMSSGKILVWHKKEGEVISRGDVLAEVETDKANLEIESFHAGTLIKIYTPANESATVGDVIAYIGQPGEQVSDNGKNPLPKVVPIVEAIPTEAPKQETVQPVQTLKAVVQNFESDDRIKVSPLARKLAEQKSINLQELSGSGPNGRIVKKDIEEFRPVSNVMAEPASRTQIREMPTPRASSPQMIPLSKMRQTIAKRMQESVNEAPHFYTTTSVNMTEAVKFRALLKPREDFKGISINHLIIKATAYALAHEPKANCSMRDGQIYNPGEINVGIITAIEEGLLIPVIKNTDTLHLKDVVFEARAAIERARAGRPTSSDLTGGTFSISNMGMYDVENFTAIINPGQGAILAVSAMQESAVVLNGKVVVAPVLKATISADHRIIDGIISATFLKHFKKALENPALLLL